MSLDDLAAREEIRNLILRWCRAIDRLDFDAIREVFHPDAYDDHGSFKGGVEALIDWIRERHSGIPFSMHSVSNCLVDFLGADEAVVESYCLALQKYPAASRKKLEVLVGPLDIPSSPYLDMTVACRYVDLVSRREGVWRIEKRTVVLDSVSVLPGIELMNPDSAGWVTGKRGGEGRDRDHVYRMLSGNEE